MNTAEETFINTDSLQGLVFQKDGCLQGINARMSQDFRDPKRRRRDDSRIFCHPQLPGTSLSLPYGECGKRQYKGHLSSST